MIKYNPKDWFGLIFRFHQSPPFRRLLWVIIALGVIASVIVWVELHYFTFTSTIAAHSLLGFVIGLLLVFRTNSGYDRWWEGRKQWGALVNNCRNLAIKINSVLPKDDHDTRTFFSTMISNYVVAMKDHLREGATVENLKAGPGIDLTALSKLNHIPNGIAKSMYERLNQLYRSGQITGDELITIDKELKALTDIIGACERIRNTPIPYSYNLFLKKIIFIYVITMPFGLVYDFQYWTIPVVCFTLYVFGSLEILAEEIEEPFGTDENDLPTDDLAEKISEDVAEILLT